MKKLEIIIEDLEEIVVILQRKLDECLGHDYPEKHLFYGLSHIPDYGRAHEIATALGAAKRELMFYENLDYSRAHTQNLQYEIRLNQMQLESAKKNLVNYQAFLVNHKNYTPEHLAYIEAKIKGLKNRIAYITSEITELTMELENAQCIHDTTHNEDLLYSLISNIYNNKLERLEIRVKNQNNGKLLAIHIKVSENAFLVYFENTQSSTQENIFSLQQKKKLSDVGYLKTKEGWAAQFEKGNCSLNELVLTISRTLFEVFHIGAGKEIELRYSEYK